MDGTTEAVVAILAGFSMGAFEPEYSDRAGTSWGAFEPEVTGRVAPEVAGDCDAPEFAGDFVALEVARDLDAPEVAGDFVNPTNAVGVAPKAGAFFDRSLKVTMLFV